MAVALMAEQPTPEMRVTWSGPYAWPEFEGVTKLPALPRHSGIYLQYRGSYLLYAVGITKRAFRERFMDHTRKYMAGHYNILDPIQAKNGVRSVMWAGYQSGRPERRAEWEARKAELQDIARQKMAETGIFVTEVKGIRMRERLEAAIWTHLLTATPFYRDAPAKGKRVFMVPRRPSEQPISVLNSCESKLHGLPERLPI